MVKKSFKKSIENRESNITKNPFLQHHINQEETDTVNVKNKVNTVNTKNTPIKKIMRSFRLDKNLANKLKDKTFDLRKSQAEILEDLIKKYL